MKARLALELLAAWCNDEAAKLRVVEPGAMVPSVYAESQAAGLDRAAEKAAELAAEAAA